MDSSRYSSLERWHGRTGRVSRISRKELKTDEVVQEVSRTVEYVQSHKERLTLVGTVLGVVAVLALGSWLVYDKRSTDASEAFGRALRTYHARVRPVNLAADPNEPDQRTFPTEKDKYEAAVQDFRAVADKYGWLKQGKMARYYVGLSYASLGNLAEAEKELNEVIRSGNTDLASLARFALAGAKANAGKSDEAEQIFRQLVDSPSGAVSKQGAQLALAAHLATSKPAEAEKIYKELEAQNPAPEVMNEVRKGLAVLKK
jgi:hypothetical protein